MRLYEIVTEAADPFAAVKRGIKARYRVLEPEDWPTLSTKFSNAADFADRVVDTSSPAANAARSVLLTAWEAWHASGMEPIPHNPLANLGGLKKHIAKAIQATGCRRSREVPWGNDMMFGPDCYVFDTPRGGVFLDATVIKHEVWMSQISTEMRGNGLGTSVMDAIHTYAVQHGFGVQVFKVTNRRKFFDRFTWLHTNDGGRNYTSL